MNVLSVISALCGAISVVQCSRRKMSFYWFGFAQLITYVVLCWRQRFYGEIAENAFYFITMIYGLWHWLRNYNVEQKEVITRRLSLLWSAVVALFTAIGIAAMYLFVRTTDDTQPFMDSITTVPAFVAQILMILRYRESWFYWLIIDVGSVVMWAIAGDWCMTAQFVFWTLNCIYGYYKWSK